MRVPVCLDCNALMESRREGSRYVHCHKCGGWFPLALVNRRHRDGSVNTVWTMSMPWGHWVRQDKIRERV